MTVNSQVAPAVQGSILRRELGMRSKDPQKLAELWVQDKASTETMNRVCSTLASQIQEFCGQLVDILGILVFPLSPSSQLRKWRHMEMKYLPKAM